MFGDVVALLVTETLPDKLPADAGANFTLMLQFPPDAKELPQVLVWLKFPFAEIPVIERVAPPGLESVTVCAALVVPTVWPANVSEVGATLAPGKAGDAPVPVKLTV